MLSSGRARFPEKFTKIPRFIDIRVGGMPCNY